MKDAQEGKAARNVGPGEPVPEQSLRRGASFVGEPTGKPLIMPMNYLLGLVKTFLPKS